MLKETEVKHQTLLEVWYILCIQGKDTNGVGQLSEINKYMWYGWLSRYSD